MGQPSRRDPLPPPQRHGPLRRVAAFVAGGVLLILGIVLLILPGPGLLVVLGGLYVLALGFPSVQRYVDPMSQRAMRAAEESVSTPLRITGSVLVGLTLIGAGVVWGSRSVPWLPLAGWSTGSSLILSGGIVLALLIYSYRTRTRATTRP